MRRSSNSLILLFVLGFALVRVPASGLPASLARGQGDQPGQGIIRQIAEYRPVSMSRPHRAPAYSDRAVFVRALPAAQTPVVTLSLATDQIFKVKTAQGIATRIVFPDKVTESICGDLYDPVSGKGTFVVQNSGRDVFIKPIASRGVSNLFVTTGEGATRRIYSFDLDVVSPDRAHRVVNVVTAVPPQKSLTQPAPQPAQPLATRPNPATATLLASADTPAKPPAKQAGFASSNPPMIGNIAVSDFAGARAAFGMMLDVLDNNSLAELPPPAPDRMKKKDLRPDPKLDPQRTIRKSGGVLVGEAIKKVQPFYPLRAKAARIGGSVLVEVTVDEKGDVVAARALGGNPLLTDAAVDAALRWRFNPTKLGGQPVKVVGTITFNFVL